ncbi:ABC transporter C family protein [Heterostelium album PN500]|uniref:ABC transporter C family protein n=1 Tax=Heterostelium pallidum (strain ATCC 26659 / Pp 5 / PN500) TaxID=670386 RepID=D3BMG7_HETP5|nr:ABC transporter C family protein [Heterostelium album PN500]EFA77179.1 ABC transporter C family protein [Heterostelium album PN500]|eukprot:XP_020429308.1 ABC transporter C family protein [Heterostelium album PN500]
MVKEYQDSPSGSLDNLVDLNNEPTHINRIHKSIIGVKKPLEFEDIYPIAKRCSSGHLLEKFESIWKVGKDFHPSKTENNNNNNSNLNNSQNNNNNKSDKKKKSKKTKSLIGTLNSQFGWSYHLAFIFKFIGDACEFVYPFMIYKLVSIKLILKYVLINNKQWFFNSKQLHISKTNFVQDTSEPYWHGLIYSGILLAAYLVHTVCICHWEYRAYTVAFNVRSTLVAAIYKKSLLISNSVREKENKGKGNTLNLVSMDVDMVESMFQNFQYIQSVPLQIIASIILLYRLLSWSALIGFGSLLVFLPLNFYSAMKQAQIGEEVMKRKDKRTSQVTEAINSVRVLKFYGWINLMFDKIMALRNSEVKEMKKLNVFTSFLYLFWFLLPDFVTVTTYCAFALFGNQLEMATILSSLTIFFIVRFPLSLLPHLVAGMSLSVVSMNRIQAFLMNEELEEPKTTLAGSTFYGEVDPDFESKGLAVSIKDATFQWSFVNLSGDDGKEGAENAKESTDKNEKKEEKKEEKKPLLINDDGEQNGIPIDEKVEDEVKFLLKDINLEVNNGELAVVIGPVGSGKSSLLSSLLGDLKLISGGCALQGNIAYVSQLPWIMNGTLRDNILFGKEYDQQKYQNILEVCELTQDLELLPKSDLTVIGEKGINLSGGQKQRVCIARAIYHDSDLYLLDDPLAALDIHVAQKIFKNAILPMIPKKTVILVSHQMYPLEFSDKIVTMNNGVIENICKYEEMSRETWEVYQFQNQNAKKEKDEEEIKKKEGESADEEKEEGDDDLILEEDRNIGKVSYKQYFAYFKHIGVIYMTISTLLGLMGPGLSTFGNYWLTRWAQEWQLQNHPSLWFYLGIYFLSSILMSFCVFGVTLANTFGGLAASQQIHKRALTKVLNSPVQFFDQNLSGRIINRFSKDISNLDSSLPLCLGDARDSLLNSLSVIIMIGIASPVVLILLIPIFIAFYFLQKWYLNNARELQRLASLSLSPVLTHFSETLTGQNVIRAFHARERFLNIMTERIDLNLCCNLYQEFVAQWTFFRLGVLCTLFVVGASLSATFLRGHISEALIGLALSYSITLSGELNWTFIQLSIVETQMNSVERLHHYCNLETEKLEGKETPSWPQNGRIRFKNFSMRYRPELPPSLNDINLEIEAGSKVGICGRTGAGKSSLLLALFRLVEADSGHIEIDNENIDQVALQDLRSKMSIIPQDPVLFAGTLRYNLDPFSTATDAQLWEVIERVHLKEKIKSLDCLVSEDGGNYSVGQRQLMCLARALIRKSKIIALDEATAAVDLETDAVIQKTIREEFKDSTVITIAHRLNTIIDYDKIVLMSEGRVKQVGKPSELIELVEENSANANNNPDNQNLSPTLQSQSSTITNNETSLI